MINEKMDRMAVETFLKEQTKLFDEPVAETYEEAEEFLTDMLAVIVDNISETREYLDEAGMDVSELKDEDMSEVSEVFPLEDGRYLILMA